MRTALVKYVEDKDVLTFFHVEHREWFYDFDFARLATRRAFIDFVYHLEEKRWIKDEHIYDLFKAIDTGFMHKHGKTAREYYGAYGAI